MKYPKLTRALLALLLSTSPLTSSSFEVENKGADGWYSSSYLSFVWGYLTREKGKNGNNDEVLTTAQRFDQAVKKVLGNKEAPLAAYLDEFGFGKELMTPEEIKKVKAGEHLESYANDWTGVCDQWSAANNDVKVKEALSLNPHGLNCKGTILTKGDIQELFTALYRSYDNTDLVSQDDVAYHYEISSYYGARDYTPRDDRSSAYWDARRGLDVYNFQAKDVHFGLHFHLYHEESLVINVDSGPQVWNQPANAYNSTYKVLSEKDLAAILDSNHPMYQEEEGNISPPNISSGYLRAVGRNGKSQLSSIKSVEAYHRAVLNNPSISFSALKNLKDRKISKTFKKLLNKWTADYEAPTSPQEFLFIAKELKNNLLMKGLKGGTLKFKRNLRVEHVKSVLTYQQEVEFKETQDAKINKKYEYILFERALKKAPYSKVLQNRFNSRARETIEDLEGKLDKSAFYKTEYERWNSRLKNGFHLTTPHKSKNKEWVIIGSSWLTDEASIPGDMFVSPSILGDYDELGKSEINSLKRALKKKRIPKRNFNVGGVEENPKFETFDYKAKALGIHYLMNLLNKCDKLTEEIHYKKTEDTRF